MPNKHPLLGFTLIELLLVIAIIGILAAIVAAAINPAQKLQQARNARRKSDLSQMAGAIMAYAATHDDQYPSTSGYWCGAAGSNWYNCGADWIPGLVADGDLMTLPKDPRTGQSFPPCNDAASASYIYYSNGTDYKLLAHCTPEGTLSPTDPFYDPVRPGYAWQVSSPGGINW